MHYVKTMRFYGELDPTPEHTTRFVFEGKKEHITQVNVSYIACPSQHIDIETPHGSRDHVIVDLDIKSTDKTRSIVKNVGRARMKKKVLVLGSKEIGTIINADIFDAYKDLYLSKKECEDKLLQGVQSANGLKLVEVKKKADDTAITITTNENAIRKTFGRRL